MVREVSFQTIYKFDNLFPEIPYRPRDGLGGGQYGLINKPQYINGPIILLGQTYVPVEKPLVSY